MDGVCDALGGLGAQQPTPLSHEEPPRAAGCPGLGMAPCARPDAAHLPPPVPRAPLDSTLLPQPRAPEGGRPVGCEHWERWGCSRGQLVGAERPRVPTCCEASEGQAGLPCLEGGAAAAPAFPGPGCSVSALGMPGQSHGAPPREDRPSDRPHLAPGPCWGSREGFLGEA